MTATYSADQIAEIQRRTLRTLTLGQIVGSAALAASVTVGAFVIQEIPAKVVAQDYVTVMH